MGSVVSLSMRGFADLTDVTLVDEDTKSILTNNANRAIQGLVAIQVTHPRGQIVTNASGAIRWPNLQLMQVAEFGTNFK